MENGEVTRREREKYINGLNHKVEVAQREASATKYVCSSTLRVCKDHRFQKIVGLVEDDLG